MYNIGKLTSTKNPEYSPDNYTSLVWHVGTMLPGCLYLAFIEISCMFNNTDYRLYNHKMTFLQNVQKLRDPYRCRERHNFILKFKCLVLESVWAIAPAFGVRSCHFSMIYVWLVSNLPSMFCHHSSCHAVVMSLFGMLLFLSSFFQWR